MLWNRNKSDLEKGPASLGQILCLVNKSATSEERKTAKILAAFVTEEIRRRMDERVDRPQGYFVRFTKQYNPRIIRAVISHLRWRFWTIEECSGETDSFRIMLNTGGAFRPLETITVD